MATVQADLVLNIDEALSAIEALGDLISDVTSNVVVDVGVDTSEAEAGIEGLAAETVEVPVDADVDAAQSEIDSLEGEPVDVPVTADVSDAEAEIATLDGETVEIGVTVDTGDAEAQLQGVTSQVEELGGQSGIASQGVEGLEGALGAASVSGASAALGYAAVGTALVGVVSAAAEASGVLAVATTTIENMGSQSGVTVEGVQALATNLQQTAGFSDEATIAAAGLIARYGELNNEVGEGNDIFDRTLTVGADLARVLGTDITSAADLLGKAVANPEAGIGRLARQFPVLRGEVGETIVSLQQSGDLLGAQRLLLDTVSESVEGAAAAYGDSLAGQLDIAKESMGELAESAGGVLAPAVTGLAADLTELFSTGSGAVTWANETIESVSGISDAMGTLGDVAEFAFTNLNPIGLASNFRDLAAAVTSTETAAIPLGVLFGRIGIDVEELRRQKLALQAEEPANAEATAAATEALAEQERAFQQLVDGYVAGAPDISSAISEVEGNLNDFGQTIDSATDARLVLDNLDQSIEAFRNFSDNLETIGQTSTEVRDVLAVINPEIAGGLAQALASGNPALIRQFQERIREIERFGGDAVRLFGGNARDSVNAYERPLRDLQPITRRETRGAISALQAERNAALNAGRGLGDNMARGTDRGASEMRPAARGGALDAVQAVKDQVDAAKRGGELVGGAMAAGMARGIANGSSAVASAAAAAVNNAVAAANAAAGISSPSKVFMEMGEEMTAGLALGLMDVDPVVAAAAFLADAAISEISQKKTEWDAAVFGPSGVDQATADKATWLAAADPSFSAIYSPAPADDGGQRDGQAVYNFTLNIDAANQDPVAVGDAVVSAVESSLFRASVVGARRRRG